MPPEAVSLLHVMTRDHARGAERVAVELHHQLDALGWEQETVALFPGNHAQGHLAVRPLARSRIGSLWALRRCLVDRAPVVVLAHGGTAAAFSAVAGMGVDATLFWQRILMLPESMWRRRTRRAFWRWVASRCAGVVALTSGAAAEMRRLGYSGRVVVIPNHRPLGEFLAPGPAGEAGPIVGMPPGVPVFGFVGHMVDQKDPLAAVRVADRILSVVSDAHFVLAGDGPLMPDVAAASAASTFADRIHVLGHVEDVVGLLSRLDLVLITSTSESMTGVAVECLMAGCPVVAYELDGFDVLLGDTGAGLLVPHGDEPALASAAADLLTDRAARVAMSRRGMEHRSEFSTEHVAEQYDLFLRTFAPVDSDAADPGLRPSRRPTRKVVYLMPNLGVGGAEQALAVLARHLDRMRWQPEVMTLHAPRRPRQETILPVLEELGVGVTNLDVPGRADRSPIALVRATTKLRRALRTAGADLVDSALFEADLTCRLATWGLSIRHVSHLVNTTYDPVVEAWTPGSAGWRFRVVRMLDRLSGLRTDRFIALTGAVKASAGQELRLPAAKVRVVPRGVDTTHFPLLDTAPGPVRRLLAVGRLVPQKNHLHLLRALVATPDLELTVLGEGPLAGDLVAAIRELGLQDRVRLMRPTRAVQAVHAEHDAFVMPSLWEGQSNALIEAMSSGLPIVASDIPVLREVLGSCAVFVAPERPDDIARGLRILQCMSPDERRVMSLALRDRAHTKYGAPAATRCLEGAYDELFER